MIKINCKLKTKNELLEECYVDHGLEEEDRRVKRETCDDKINVFKKHYKCRKKRSNCIKKLNKIENKIN
jgi:hypothetical protein